MMSFKSRPFSHLTLDPSSLVSRSNAESKAAQSQGCTRRHTLESDSSNSFSFCSTPTSTGLEEKGIKMMKQIGRGAYGKVFLIRDENSKKICALKSVHKARALAHNTVHQISMERQVLMKASDNPWIVQLHRCFHNDKYLNMILEFLPGGDLISLLMKYGRFDENITLFYVTEIVTAVSCLHQLGFVHRDLKPDNILISSSGHIKLADMGSTMEISRDTQGEPKGDSSATHWGRCRSFSQSNATTSKNISPVNQPSQPKILVGTPDYIAPEVLLKQPYSQECDWWSVAVIMYECIFGQTPFLSATNIETCRKVIHWHENLQIPLHIAASVSQNCLQFLSALFRPIECRLGRNGAKEIRCHMWFEGVDWEHLHERIAPHPPSPNVIGAINSLSLAESSDDLNAFIEIATENFDNFSV